MKHEVISINVVASKNHKLQVLKNSCTRFPNHLLKVLREVFCKAFVLIPDQIITSAEMLELRQGGASYGTE